MESAFQQLESATARAVSISLTGSSAPQTMPRASADKDAMIMDLQRQLGEAKDRNSVLEEQIKLRIASFINREQQAKRVIDVLESELSSTVTTDAEFQAKLGTLRDLYGTVISRIGNLQNRQAAVLQSQEQQLLRAFRTRFEEVSTQLDSVKSKKGDYNAELQARLRRVISELHSSQELSQVLDKKNQLLVTENAKLVEELRTRKDDRAALVKELVSVRREKDRLDQLLNSSKAAKASVNVTVASAAAATATAASVGGGAGQESPSTGLQENPQYERELRLRERLAQTEGELEEARLAKTRLEREAGEQKRAKSEIASFLSQCLEDVKSEVARRKKTLGIVRLDDLTAEDREKALEMLLNQKRVVELLVQKTHATSS